MKLSAHLLIFFLLISSHLLAINPDSPEAQYKAIQTKLQTGWGTFNHKSVLSHVLLPEGFAMNIGIKLHQNNADNYLKEAFISSRGNRPEKITPGFKAYDGSYSDLEVEWNGVEFRVESATTEHQDLVLLVTPIKMRRISQVLSWKPACCGTIRVVLNWQEMPSRLKQKTGR